MEEAQKIVKKGIIKKKMKKKKMKKEIKKILIQMKKEIWIIMKEIK